MAKHRDKELEAKGFVQKIILAFGMPKDPNKFRDKEPKRMAWMNVLCIRGVSEAWVKEMLEAAICQLIQYQQYVALYDL